MRVHDQMRPRLTIVTDQILKTILLWVFIIKAFVITNSSDKHAILASFPGRDEMVILYYIARFLQKIVFLYDPAIFLQKKFI